MLNVSPSLLTILLSGVASGVIAAYVSYRLNKHKDDIVFMTQKAEDLFIHAEEWLGRLERHFLRHFGLFKNELDFNQINQMNIDAGKDDERHYQKMSMAISIYFPDLKNPLSEVESVRDRLNGIIYEFNRAYKKGNTDGSPWFQRFHSTVGQLSKANEAFLQAVVDTARRNAVHRIAHPPFSRRASQLATDIRSMILGAVRRVLRRSS